MTTTTRISPSNAPLLTETTANNPPPLPAPHAKDSLEMKEPVQNTGLRSSICARIGSLWKSIKTKILQLINYFLPNLVKNARPEFFTATLNVIQDPAWNYESKLSSFKNFLSSRRIHLAEHPTDRITLDACTREIFAALPPDLAGAIIKKAFQFNCPLRDLRDKIEISIQGQENITLPVSQLEGGVNSLMFLYLLSHFSFPNASLEIQRLLLAANWKN